MGFFEKLKQGLTKTKNAILHRADALFRSLSGEIDEDFYEELEEMISLAASLIAAMAQRKERTALLLPRS